MASYLTYNEVGITIGTIGIVLAFVVLVWQAIKAIHDGGQMIRKPTAERLDDHEKRIKELEGCCNEVCGKLDADWKWQQDEREINSLMLRSIKQLLQHEIDGNDTKALEAMEAEIDKWLFDHAK